MADSPCRDRLRSGLSHCPDCGRASYYDCSLLLQPYHSSAADKQPESLQKVEKLIILGHFLDICLLFLLLCNMNFPSKYVFTIGRAFGAGGRAVGRALAERLNIEYFDKELLAQAARRSGMDTGIFEKNDERAPGFLAGLLPMSMGYNAIAWYAGPNNVSGEAVYQAQSDFIRHAATQSPCVIVGRTADYVLRDTPNVINIFLHAPEEACIDRIINRADCHDRDAARNLIRKTNKLRAEFYNFYTDRTWGAAKSYDLTIDSSRLTVDEIVDTIIEYATRRFAKNNDNK